MRHGSTVAADLRESLFRMMNHSSDHHVAGASIPFSTLLMNPLATWPVTSIRCSRIASEAPNPPRSLSVQPVVRCARIRKSSAVRTHCR
jgi:hypothetical protein